MSSRPDSTMERVRPRRVTTCTFSVGALEHHGIQVQHGAARCGASQAKAPKASKKMPIAVVLLLNPSAPCVERIVMSRLSHGLLSISLRYFNAAGADPDGEIGEERDSEGRVAAAQSWNKPRRVVSVAQRSNGSRKARARSSGGGCHAVASPPTRSGFSFMHSPTISATSCGRWRCPRRRSRGC